MEVASLIRHQSLLISLKRTRLGNINQKRHEALGAHLSGLKSDMKQSSGSEIPRRSEGNVQMKVVKLIAGFSVGALCFGVFYYILNFALPVLSRVVTGSEWEVPPIYGFLSLILNILVIWIGAGFAPKVWKRGIRAGAVSLALLGVLALVGFFVVGWIVLTS